MSRTRYVYTHNGQPLKEPIVVSDEWRDPHGRSTGDLGKFEYDGLRATDGTDISSREKHRAYMKKNNLALAHEYKGTWDKATQERGEFYAGNSRQQAGQRRQAISTAVDMVRAGHKPGRG